MTIYVERVFVDIHGTKADDFRRVLDSHPSSDGLIQEPTYASGRSTIIHPCFSLGLHFDEGIAGHPKPIVDAHSMMQRVTDVAYGFRTPKLRRALRVSSPRYELSSGSDPLTPFMWSVAYMSPELVEQTDQGINSLLEVSVEGFARDVAALEGEFNIPTRSPGYAVVNPSFNGGDIPQITGKPLVVTNWYAPAFELENIPQAINDTLDHFGNFWVSDSDVETFTPGNDTETDDVTLGRTTYELRAPRVASATLSIPLRKENGRVLYAHGKFLPSARVSA